VHSAYPEGLRLVERENRESLLLIGARSWSRKEELACKENAREKERNEAKKKMSGNVGES